MDGPEFIKTLEKLRETLREAVKHKGERRTPLSTRTDLLVEYSYGVRATPFWYGRFELIKKVALYSLEAPFL